MPQAVLPAGKARIAAELAGRAPRVRLLAEERQPPDCAVTSPAAMGLHSHRSKGMAEMERTEKLSTAAVRVAGGEMEVTKLSLERGIAAVAGQRRFGWVAVHVDEGVEQEETWRRLSVTRPRATDPK